MDGWMDRREKLKATTPALKLRESELLSKDFNSRHQVEVMKQVNTFLQSLLPHQKRFFATPELRPWFLTFVSPTKSIDLDNPNSAKVASKLPYSIFR